MSNPIKPTIKSEIMPIIFILIACFSSFYFYAHFPDQVPLHWNFAGEVDSYGSRIQGAFLMPAMMIGMYLLFLFIPLIDPKKERYAQFRKIYHVFKGVLLFFMLLIYYALGLSGLGYNIEIGTWIPVFVGLLFIILGNYMGKIKPNWFMGIRTPWTLSSEEVWNKTHRFGGKAFIIGGVLMVFMSLIPVAYKIPIFIIVIVIVGFLPIIYSYILFIGEKRAKANK